MSTLREDLALERYTLARIKREMTEHWRMRRYKQALECRRELARAQERITELEGRL